MQDARVGRDPQCPRFGRDHQVLGCDPRTDAAADDHVVFGVQFQLPQRVDLGGRVDVQRPVGDRQVDPVATFDRATHQQFIAGRQRHGAGSSDQVAFQFVPSDIGERDGIGKQFEGPAEIDPGDVGIDRRTTVGRCAEDVDAAVSQ